MLIGSQISSSPTPRNLSRALSSSSTIKFNRSPNDPQVFLNKEFALAPAIIEDPFGFVNNLNRCPLSLFSYFISLSFRCRHMYATQEHIAKKAGMSVRSVQRATDEFERLGILIVRYRHNTSNEYRFNPFFHDQELYHLIRSVTMGVKFISMKLLKPFRRIEYRAPRHKGSFTGSNTKCRTKIIPSYLYNRISYRLTPLNNTPCAREDITLYEPMSKAEQEESLMHQANNREAQKNPFSRVVTRVGLLLKLTPAGKVDMVRYPEQALLYAEKLYGTSGFKAKDKLRWFHYVCNKYCKDNKLRVDHHYAGILYDQMGLTPLHDKVEQPSKSNGDERSQSGQYSETGRAHSFSLNESSSITKHAETNDFKKERENEDYLDSYPETQSHPLEPSQNRQQQGMERRTHSDNREYSPVSGTHYAPKATSSQERISNKPPASPEEAQMHMQNILKMLSEGFRMEPEKKEVAPRIKTPEQIKNQLETMLEIIKESNKDKAKRSKEEKPLGL